MSAQTQEIPTTTPAATPRPQVVVPVDEQPYLKRGARLRSFLFTSLLAVGCSLVLFMLLVRMDQLDLFFREVLKVTAYFKPVMALIAASPLFFSLLVGYGYMDRAMKRRAREAKEAAARANSAN